MASLIHWTWTWANSRRWWWTEKPGVLQSMGLQRVRHNLATEQQQQYGYTMFIQFIKLTDFCFASTSWPLWIVLNEHGCGRFRCKPYNEICDPFWDIFAKHVWFKMRVIICIINFSSNICWKTLWQYLYGAISDSLFCSIFLYICPSVRTTQSCVNSCVINLKIEWSNSSNFILIFNYYFSFSFSLSK